MKKLTLIIPILLAGMLAMSQTTPAPCPITTCMDSLAYSQTKDTLVVTAALGTPSSVKWRIFSGPGTIVNPLSLNTSIVGLKPGMTTTVLVDIDTGNLSSTSLKVITVAPVPVVHPTVTGLSFSSGKWQFTFSDGFIQTL